MVFGGRTPCAGSEPSVRTADSRITGDAPFAVMVERCESEIRFPRAGAFEMDWKAALSLTLTAVSAAACGSDMVGVSGNPSHDVSISVQAPGACLVGGCDPANSEAH